MKARTSGTFTYAGCNDGDAKQANCSANVSPDKPAAHLIPNKFTYRGVEYAVTGLYTSTEFFTPRLHVRLGSDVPRHLSTATLHVGPVRPTTVNPTRTYAFTDDADPASDALEWDLMGSNWTDGQKVSVRLIAPPPPPLPVAPAAHTVHPNWPLKPAGVGPGESFRLLFVTSTTTKASEPGIDHYNTHVQNAADGNASLRPFKYAFRALISTEDVDARINTATITAYTDAPIYWLGGDKVADDYADFYDGRLGLALSRRPRSRRRHWTGTYCSSGSARMLDGTMHATQIMLVEFGVWYSDIGQSG